MDEMRSDNGEARVFRDLLGFIRDDTDPFARLLKFLPLVISALFPVREVLLVDGAAAEAGVEHLFHLAVRIEPFDETDTLLAIVETAVEFVADVAREAGDFAVAGHGIGCLGGSRFSVLG
jgi:hypothetical protein